VKFIGLDIGTTSICGIVLDTRSGRLQPINRDNNSWVRTKNKWERIQDPNKILGIAQDVISELHRRNKDVAGIGVTGQMHGITYINKHGAAVSPLYTWQDARGSLLYKSTKKTYSRVMSQQTGYMIAPGFGMLTHWYNRVNGLVPADAVKFCTIQDYVVMRLAGRAEPMMDTTNAASLGAFNLRENIFDIKALSSTGIKQKELPEVVSSGTIAGKHKNLPVYSALGDNQASFLGSVRNIDNTVLLNIGTGGQVSAYTRKYVKIDGLDVRPFPGGGYLVVGALLCGGKAYSLLENFFRNTAEFFSLPSGKTDFYERMNSIKYNKLVEDLNIDTRFAGTRQDPSIRGAINSISMNNFRPEYLVAGFLNGMANELHDFYAMMPELIRNRMRSFVGSGNGIRRNNLLRSIISGRFGHKISVPMYCEEASVGAALTAAVGSGFFKDFHSVGRVIKYSRG